jgi:hypothetical protein
MAGLDFHPIAERAGGSNMTTIRLFPHRRHLNRLSSDDNGNARPRVHTSVSKSKSVR